MAPREVYFAIVDEAKAQGIGFAGHVPMSVSALEASDAGQKSMVATAFSMGPKTTATRFSHAFRNSTR